MTNHLVVEILLAVFGLVLIAGSLRARRRRGFARGSSVALDNVTLFSARLRLVGRPDRIVRRGKTLIPEEWKSGRRLELWHKYQLGTYFILIEEHYGVRSPYGLVVLANGKRHQVENTDRLRDAVIAVAHEIRSVRHQAHEVLAGTVLESRCRACGQRTICRQRFGGRAEELPRADRLGVGDRH